MNAVSLPYEGLIDKADYDDHMGEPLCGTGEPLTEGANISGTTSSQIISFSEIGCTG